MKFTKIALTLLCSTIIFCACGKTDSDIVLKVNDTSITRKEFYDDFDKIKSIQLKNAPKEFQKDSSYTVLALKDKYTNDVIVRTLLTQEFEKRKIEVTPEELKTKKEQIIKQLGSEEQLKNILKQGGISEERFDSDMTNEVKMDKLAASLDVKAPSDSEVEKYYRENKEKFSIPETALVSHILIDTNPDNIKRKITDEDKDAKLSNSEIEQKVKQEVERKTKLVNELQEKAAKNPANFAALAKEYSEDEATAQKGGDLGYIVREQMVKEFGDAAFTQKVGVVGPVVKTQYGEHIILVKDRAKGGVQPYANIKADLKQYLLQQRKVAAVQELVSGLKAQAKVEYLDNSLNPNTLNKQLEASLAKQIQAQTKKQTPKLKFKTLENDKAKESK